MKIIFGTCPICNGTGRKQCPDEETRRYGLAHGQNGYDKTDDTIACDNCGAQYMYGVPNGRVSLRKSDGMPCTHEYKPSLGQWRNTTNYDCIHCGDHYMIDSGD